MRVVNRKHIRRGYYLISLLLLTVGWPIIIGAQRLPLRTYTSADGLGSSAIFHLSRDARGFLWISSRDGLIRFDGYRFITYRIGTLDADPAIFRLLAARNGTYWIDVNKGPDYRFAVNGSSGLIEPLPQEGLQDDLRVPLEAELVTGIPTPHFEDSSGNLWSGDQNGLYLIQKVDGGFVSRHIELKLSSTPGRTVGVYAYHEGRDGSLWVGTRLGLVRRLPTGALLHLNLHPKREIDISVTEDRDGRIWIARADALFVLKPEAISELTNLREFTTREVPTQSGRLSNDGRPQLPQRVGEVFMFRSADLLRRDDRSEAKKIQPSAILYKVFRASDDRLYFSTNKGLLIFDGERFRQYVTPEGMTLDLGVAIAEDSEGNIWLGGNAGLVRLNTRGLMTFSSGDGVADPNIRSIFEDRAGELHLVTPGWFISSFRNGLFRSTRLGLPKDSTATWRSNVALLDSHGELWVATQQKLYRYSGIASIGDLAGKEPTGSYDTRDGLSGDAIFCIFEDSRGDLWISTFHSTIMAQRGLTRWERATEKFHAFSETEGFPSDEAPSAFAEDRYGTLWFGLAHGGLVRYRNNRFEVFERDRLPSGGITDLHIDRTGRLWVASATAGVSRLDDPSPEHPVFRTYSVADGLASNNARCISEDLQGNIYVGTARGVNRLSPETVNIKYYGIADGLAADFVNAAYRDRDGALWFGTSNGVSRLVPRPEKLSSPDVLISGLRIAGVEYGVSPLGQIEIVSPELTASQNNLQIDFFSASVGAASSLRYQYKLEGTKTEWSAPSSQRTVTFASLSPGTYRFMVRAVSPEGSISAQPATISFRILPPIWQRWWFIAIAAFALAGSLYLAHRYRVRRLLELERVRTRIATDLHDDIGASLSQIAILSEVANQQLGRADAAVKEPLEQIAGSSRELVDAMGDIVWAINPKRDRVRDLSQRMRRFASDMFTSCNIEFQFHAPDMKQDTKLGADIRRQVFLIFKEIVNNAVRHSGCTKAEIDFKIERDELTLRVADNGKGLQPNGNTDGHGLASMRQRATELGGNFQITSERGDGTTVSVRLPLNGLRFGRH